MNLTESRLRPRRTWQDQELREHQEDKHALFASPRLGKTQVAVEWLRELAASGVDGLLVSAPLRVCPLWVETLQEAGLPVVEIFDTSCAKARTMLAGDWPGVVVVNIDKLDNLRTELCKGVVAYVCDEVHETKSPSSSRGRAARKIAKTARYVRILTGTPVPNHHGDLWSPLTMVGGYTGSWGGFMQRYTVRDFYFPSKVIGHANVKELHEMVKGCASIVRREDVFGPDTYQLVERRIQMPPAAMKAYRTLANAWVLEEPVNMEATHVLSRMTRLQQITSGYLPDVTEEGGVHVLHTAKIDAAMADLGEMYACDEKAVVFHHFVAEGNQMVAALNAARIPAFIINGTLSAKESEAQRALFTGWRGGAVIVVQIQSGSTGISLAEAAHALYLSRTFSFVQDEQSRDRIYKPGARRTLTYYTVPGTIDAFIAKTLVAKRGIHDAVRHATRASIVFGEETV